MASGERLDIRASSAQCSSDAAAMTDFKEQPDTPGPQPRQGAKAFSVPVMENTEFSSKLPGFSSPVLASVVEEGSVLLPEADALSEAGAALDAGLLAEPPQAASRQPSKAAHSSSARERIYFDVIRKTSVTGAPASRRSNAGSTL
jgi:hypothetical protein